MLLDAFWTFTSGGVELHYVNLPAWADTVDSGISISCLQEWHRQGPELND